MVCLNIYNVSILSLSLSLPLEQTNHNTGIESEAATLWDLVVQGIPNSSRVDVWLALCGVDDIRARILEKSKMSGQEYYNSLVARAELELSEQLQDQIDRDLPRTVRLLL